MLIHHHVCIIQLNMMTIGMIGMSMKIFVKSHFAKIPPMVASPQTSWRLNPPASYGKTQKVESLRRG